MKRSFFISCLSLVFFASSYANAAIKVSATIKPIQSIVQYIAGDKISVNLLVRRNDTPHGYSLKPSDVRSIHSSDIVFFVSAELEVFMKNIIENSEYPSKSIALSKIEGIKLFDGRKANIWAYDRDSHKHEHEHEHDHHDHDEHGHDEVAHSHEGMTDYHIWLDIDNAITMARYIAKILILVDKENEKTYTENLDKFIIDAEKNDKAIMEKLKLYKKNKFIVFHDAYQYFEKRYGLASEGSVIINPLVTSSALKLSAMKKDIENKNIECIFKEPQFTPKIIDTIAKGTKIKIGTLDAEWGVVDESHPVSQHYFILLNGLADSLISCFKQNNVM